MGMWVKETLAGFVVGNVCLSDCQICLSMFGVLANIVVTMLVYYWLHPVYLSYSIYESNVFQSECSKLIHGTPTFVLLTLYA